eukprot:2646118-Prorocentrum_lima.AAC.1
MPKEGTVSGRAWKRRSGTGYAIESAKSRSAAAATQRTVTSSATSGGKQRTEHTLFVLDGNDLEVD